MRLFVSIALTLLGVVSAFGVPETINIQGSLKDAAGQPLVGTRAYRIQFFDSEENGATLGAAIDGFVTPSPDGRFSIDLAPPAQIFNATEVYYSLGIDGSVPSDGDIDPEDVFPERVKIHSVLFARMAEEANSADTANHATSADTAATALTLSGSLANPGDQIPLGGGVSLQVADDGTVEFLVGDQRFRLAGQKWFGPRNLHDSFSPDRSLILPISADVALNNNGQALIVWHQMDGANVEQVFRSEYRNGTWNDPSTLSNNISPDGQDAKNPQVALNDNGEAVIVWEQSDGMNFQIFRSEYRNGLWNDPSSLSNNISPDGQDARNPQVALNDNGEAVIVWQQSDGSNLQILRSEYRNDSWNNVSSVANNISPDGQDASIPKVALNNNGDAVIVWQQSDSANSQIFRSEYRNGSWNDVSSVANNISPDGQDAQFPQVALNDNGEAVIVWHQSDGGKTQIFRSEYRDGLWKDPSNLSNNISPDGQDAQRPEVALNDNSEAVIVWRQSDGANLQVFRSEYRDGSWIDPSSLSNNIGLDGLLATQPQVALNDNGEAVIVWLQSTIAGNQIFRSEYRNGSWIDPTNESNRYSLSPEGGGTLIPVVALNDNGDAVVVWTQPDDVGYQLFRSEFRFGF